MKVEIIHPEEKSIEIIKQSIEEGDPIRRSPHVGNLNNQELSLILGIAGIGGIVNLELVDTIHGLDNYSNPKYLMTSNNNLSLTSNKLVKNKVVGMCLVSTPPENEVIIGNDTVTHGSSIQNIHLSSINAVMPENVNVGLSSKLFTSIGEDLFSGVIEHSSNIIDRPSRKVLDCGKIIMTDIIEKENIFGLGDNPLSGMLPPLEAMMAIELIQALINSQGQDQRVVHVAGPSMIQYTKDPTIMDPAMSILDKIASEYGLSKNINIEYVIPCMMHTLNSLEKESEMISKDITSQYDMLGLAE